MASFLIIGFFAVADGRPTLVTRPVPGEQNVRQTRYFVYSTAIRCLSGLFLPAELRVFAPSHGAILPDDTVVYVVAKAVIATGPMARLEALSLSAVPGDVANDSYDEGLPDEPFPRVFLIGQVIGEAASLDEKPPFNVLTSEYVNDQPSQCTVQCYFEKERKRWKNMPSPRLNSIVSVYGYCSRLSSDGMVQIAVENITFNLGVPLTSSSPAHGSAKTVSTKERKFKASASTRAPAATDPGPSLRHSRDDESGDDVVDTLPNTKKTKTSKAPKKTLKIKLGRNRLAGDQASNHSSDGERTADHQEPDDQPRSEKGKERAIEG